MRAVLHEHVHEPASTERQMHFDQVSPSDAKEEEPSTVHWLAEHTTACPPWKNHWDKRASSLCRGRYKATIATASKVQSETRSGEQVWGSSKSLRLVLDTPLPHSWPRSDRPRSWWKVPKPYEPGRLPNCPEKCLSPGVKSSLIPESGHLPAAILGSLFVCVVAVQ